METITSRQNPLIRHVRRLAASRAYRAECGEYLCDGVKLLDEALRWNAPVRTVIFTEKAAVPVLPAGVRAVCVDAELMRYASPMETPQGALFTLALPHPALPDRLDGRHYLVLDGVQDPGNVGTIVRTADAFCCDGIFLVNACADPYGPKAARATMGAIFRREVISCEAESLVGLLRSEGIPLYGAALRDDTEDIRSVDLARAAIAVGSEGKGLSAQVLSLCDRTVRIPMSERCESLNAAVAASVALWEMFR